MNMNMKIKIGLLVFVVALISILLIPLTKAAQDKVIICHHEPENPNIFHTLTVAPSSLKAHLSHGDELGSCPAECNASTVCGNTCSYGGVTYNTVLIGTQCWFKENLNAGTMIGNLETPDNTAPTLGDPDTVSKWCYGNSSTYCADEGGLYTWAEANALADSCNSTFCGVSTPSQGICPTGWHIPTDAEQYTLENYLTTPGQTCDATRNGNDCSDAGTKLILGGSSGFDAIGAGNHETNGVGSFFDKREPSIHIWSSSEQPVIPSYAWHRTFIGGSGSPLVGRGSYIKAFGFSVRCLANTTNTD